MEICVAEVKEVHETFLFSASESERAGSLKFREDLVHGNTHKTLQVQVRWVIKLILEELEPLNRLEQYWRRRMKDRFDFPWLMLSPILALKGGVEIDVELTKVREALARGRRVIGRCEQMLSKLQRLGGTEKDSLIVQEVEFLIDQLLLAEPSSPDERVNLLLSLPVGKTDLVVEREHVELLERKVPLWDRLGPTTRSGVVLCGVFGVLYLSLGSQQLDATDIKNEIVESEVVPHGVVEDVKGFAESVNVWFGDHIKKPSQSIIKQLFFSRDHHDRVSEDAAAVVDAKSSLQHMIQNHAGKTVSVERSTSLAKNTDMSLVSADYEKQIQRPISSAVSGNLIELILIQAQYVKTEALESMLKIDELLQANQFNSQLIILAPALLVVNAMYSGLKSIYYMLVDDSSSKATAKKRLRSSLLSLSSSLARLSVAEDKEEQEGRISQLAYDLNETLTRYQDVLGLTLDDILVDILGRSGLPSETRARICDQLLITVCTST